MSKPTISNLEKLKSEYKNNEKFRKLEFSNIIIKRDEQNNSLSKTLVVSIKLNSFSPLYGSPSYRYKEKIDLNAFDESLEAVARGEKTIYSFADHSMDIKNIIGSTNDKRTKLVKENNEIRMEIPIDDDNEIGMKVYKSVEKGEIKANSFIFLSQDVEFKEYENEPTEIIIKKGELLSIDPVVYAFYPQNQMEARSIIPLNLAPETNKENKKTQEKNTMRELLLRQLALVAKSLKVEAKATKDSTDDEILDELTSLQKRQFETLVIEKLDEKAAAELRSKFEGSVNELTNAIKSNKETELVELRNKVKSLEAGQTVKLEFKDAVKEFLFGDYWMRNKEEGIQILSVLAKANAEVMKRATNDFVALATIAPEHLQKREYTGADSDSGSLIIPIFTDPRLISEDLYDLPEVNGAITIGIIGEASTKIPVDIVPTGKATPISRGDDSKKVEINSVEVTMNPVILSEYFGWNPKMMAHVQMVPQSTTNLLNRQRAQWRAAFVANLFAKAATTFAADAKTYDGGLRKEALVQTATANQFALDDLDKVTDGFIAKYGERAKGLFTFYMHSTIWGKIKALARVQSNDVTVKIDIDAMTINGFGIILNDDGTTSTMATGDNILAFYKKSNVRVYGGTTIMRDSDQVQFLSRNVIRQITTYGEVKLCDPHYDSRFLQVK